MLIRTQGSPLGGSGAGQQERVHLKSGVEGWAAQRPSSRAFVGTYCVFKIKRLIHQADWLLFWCHRSSIESKSRIVLFLFCFVLGLTCSIWKFPGQGSNGSCSCWPIATPDPSCLFDLHHSSWQHLILNPLSEARDWTHILMDTSRVRYRWATTGTPSIVLLNTLMCTICFLFFVFVFVFKKKLNSDHCLSAFSAGDWIAYSQNNGSKQVTTSFAQQVTSSF